MQTQDRIRGRELGRQEAICLQRFIVSIGCSAHSLLSFGFNLVLFKIISWFLSTSNSTDPKCFNELQIMEYLNFSNFMYTTSLTTVTWGGSALLAACAIQCLEVMYSPGRKDIEVEDKSYGMGPPIYLLPLWASHTEPHNEFEKHKQSRNMKTTPSHPRDHSLCCRHERSSRCCHW